MEKNRPSFFGKLKDTAFLSLFLFFTLILALLVTGLWLHLEREAREDARAESILNAQERALLIRDRMDELLQAQVQIASKLNRYSWVPLYYAGGDALIEGKFTDLYRLDQQKNGFLQPDTDSLFTRIFLIFPYRNTCVSYDCWTDTDSFFGILQIPPALREELLTCIRSGNGVSVLHCEAFDPRSGTIAWRIPLESIASPRAYLVEMISAEKLSRFLTRQMTDSMTGIRILTRDGDVIFDLAPGSGGSSFDCVSALAYGWRFEFGIQPAERGVHSMPFFLYLPLCVIVGAVLALIAYTPLRRLLRVTGIHRAEGSIYQALKRSLDSLREQKAEEARRAVLSAVLTGSFDGAPPDMPFFREDSFYQVCLTDFDDSDGTLRCLNALREALSGRRSEPQAEIFQLEPDEAVLILNYGEDREEALRQESALRKAAEEAGLRFCTGDLQQGCGNIRLSWQTARKKRSNLRLSGDFHFPIDAENEYIRCLRAGNSLGAKKVLSEVREHNEQMIAQKRMDPDGLLELFAILESDMRRAAAEIGEREMLSDTDFYSGRKTEEIWQEIGALSDEICSVIGKHEAGEPPSAAARLCAFTQAHFREHSLSLQTLQDQFEMSAYRINQQFREETGSTFYVFLTGLRMKLAAEMLTRGESVADTARECGYDNDYSFRRAFLKYYGVKAQDYRGG